MAADTKTLISLDNLSEYKALTDSQLNSLKSELEGEISNLSLPIEFVTSLPDASADCMNKLYLVSVTDTTTNDLYAEYICVEKSNVYSWEKFGTASITAMTTTDVTTNGSDVVTGISVTGEVITVTHGTAVTSITSASSGNGNVVSGFSNSSGSVVYTMTTAATGVSVASSTDTGNTNVTTVVTGLSATLPSSGTLTITPQTSTIKTGVTSASIGSATTSSTKVTTAITGLSASISGTTLTITPTTSPIDIPSVPEDLTDMGYAIATSTQIEGLF